MLYGEWVLLSSGAGYEMSVLGVLAVVLGTAVAVSMVLDRVRQSTLIGYFLCGLLLGPHGFGLIRDGEEIRMISEVGVILLMFTIGIEFSIGELMSMTRIALVGAPVQILGSGLLAGSVAALFGLDWKAASLVGGVVALSSTAIVLKLFQEGTATAGLANRVALGIALVQDVAAIAVMLLLPVMFGAGADQSMVELTIGGLLRVCGFGLIAVLLGRFGIPWLLRRVHHSASRELFTLTVLALCAGIAALGGWFGLSLALGAFVAGLLVSETVYSHKVMADIVPFKDLFLTLFFIAVGMLIDVHYLLGNWPTIFAAVLAILVAKCAIALVAGLASGVPLLPAVMAALGLSGIGEFSLVLLAESERYGVLAESTQQFLLVTTTATMALVPVLAKGAEPLAHLLARLPLFRHHVPPPEAELSRRIKGIEDHAIICGYGPVGQQLNESLKSQGVQTLVVDVNAVTVEVLYRQKQPCLFGDATQPEAMELARVKKARLLAITFPIYDAAREIVRLAFAMNPDLIIMARARFPSDVAQLRKMGVQEIVYEERAAGLESIRRALAIYDVDPAEIDNWVQRVNFELGRE